MIGIDALIGFVIYALVIALIFGLLWWLVTYIESQGFGPPMLYNILRIAMVVILVLVLISFLQRLL